MKLTIWHLWIPIVLAFSAATLDRAEHLLWAVVFFLCSLGILVAARRTIGNRLFDRALLDPFFSQPDVHKTHAIAMALFVIFLGSWIPDIDWLFHSHRNPLTHSALPFLVMYAICAKSPAASWDKALLVLFGYGLGSHLAIDVFQGGNVVKIPAHLELLFLWTNAGLVIFLSLRLHKRALAMSLETPHKAVASSPPAIESVSSLPDLKPRPRPQTAIQNQSGAPVADREHSLGEKIKTGAAVSALVLITALVVFYAPGFLLPMALAAFLVWGWSKVTGR